MKTKTIRGKIFIMNLLTTFFSLMLVAIVFNAAINFYFQNQVMSQLSSLAGPTKDTFSKQADSYSSLMKDNRSLVMASHKIENSFNKNISVINAKSFLVNNKFNVVQPDKVDSQDQTLENTIFNELIKSAGDNHSEKETTINYEYNKYAAILIPAPVNKININYIVLYTSLEQIAGLKNVINLILLIIILVTALLSLVISSSVSRRISRPLTLLKEHIRSLADRKFISNVNIVADNEIQELAENVNRMSEKLDAYDQAQKVFLQNASHEFRTPLMVIQSYAEGLKYGVVDDSDNATDIIVDESKRLCSLVEDLLYLSRLDTDEEMYRFKSIDCSDLIRGVTERMKVLAGKENIEISLQLPQNEISLIGDEKSYPEP